MNAPQDILYSKEHTWLKVEGNIGTIGITDFAQSKLDEIVYPDLPNIGISFKQDTVFGSVEALKTVSDLYMPVSGKVIEVNKSLINDPILINKDPYNAGWMIKIEITDSTEINKLLSAAEYGKLIG